jgi:hypothetical protein
LYSGGEKKACALDVGRLWAWSAESVRWEDKQKQNSRAMVPLPGCGLGQLKLSGRKKYPRNKVEGKTNWDSNNNLVMLSHYPVLEDTPPFI